MYFNFTLTNAVSEYKVNVYFINEIIHKHPEYLKEKIDFNQIVADFFNNPWSGGLNCNSKEIFLNQQIDTYFNLNEARLASRLDFSNIFLNNTDFFNTYNNLILEKGANGSTVIELSNLQLYQYIKETFPIYQRFILSPNAWQIIDLTPEMVNVICENENFILVSLPFHLNFNKEYLNQLRYKNKIEITINPLCSSSCLNYNECVQFENKANYQFSERTALKSCPKRQSYCQNDQTLDLSTLKKEFFTQGINHFKLNEFPYLAEKDINYLLFLTHYFIKEDYCEQVINSFLQFNF